MSFVFAHPEALAGAAGHLNGVGSAVAAQYVATAPATIASPPAAADAVSALTAAQFSAHAAIYQSVNAHANSYAATEAGITMASS